MNETWNGKGQKITHTMKVEMEKEIPSQACEERIHSQILEMYEQRKHCCFLTNIKAVAMISVRL